MALGALLALGACDEPDPCLAAAQQRSASPSGRRIATVYQGGCPGVALAPQVTVALRTNSGAGGGGVFAVRDSAARIEARWIGEDTLEVSYPRGVTIEQQRPTLQYRDAVVHVVLRERAGP